jgi:hypothetical protein
VAAPDDFCASRSTSLPAELRGRIARRLAGGALGTEDPAPGFPVADPAASVREAVAGRIGLVSVAWPGLAHPLWLRAGGGDAEAAIGALRDSVAGLDLPFLPHRIMVIGDGYLAVALAAAFPAATIASIEPAPGRARLHALNTLPWRRIVAIHNPIGIAGARLAVMTDPATGAERLVPDPQGDIVTLGFEPVLRHLGWKEADLLIVDPAVCPDLADPAIDGALAAFRRVMIRTGGVPVSTDPAIRLPPPVWRAVTVPRHAVFDRVVFGPQASSRRQPVFDIAGDQLTCTLPERGWRPVGETGFCLAAAGETPVRLALRCFAAGPAAFEAQLRLLPAPGPALRLSIGFSAAGSGREIHRAVHDIRAGETRHWRFDLPVYFGEVDIVFEVAPREGTGEGGWLEIRDPAFL